VGQIIITDAVEEDVILSLSDTELTGLNASNTKKVNFSKTPVIQTGGGGGGGAITPAVFFSGRAFPSANIEIMAIQNGQVPVGSLSNGSTNGSFNIGYNSQLPSAVDSFAIVVYDKNQNIVQTKIFKLGVNDSLFATILMAPTVYLKQDKATLGSFLGITGKGMPNYKIELMIDGVIAPETVMTDSNGNYDLNFNTYRLGLGQHTLRVRQINNVSDASDYSLEKTFSLIKSYIPKADLNNDGKVDIQDWSIFMVRYQSADTNIRSTIDINGDGVVDTSDLVLLLKALTQ